MTQDPSKRLLTYEAGDERYAPLGSQGGGGSTAGVTNIVLLPEGAPNPTAPNDGTLYLRVSGTVSSGTPGAGQADTSPPSKPLSVAVSNVTTSGCTVTWANSTDDRAVDHYQVLIDGKAVGNTASPTFTVTGLLPATTHAITVKAWDAASNSSPASDPASVTTTAPPFTGSLYAAYDFSENAGTTTADKTGNGHALTLHTADGNAAWVSGKTGSGIGTTLGTGNPLATGAFSDPIPDTASGMSCSFWVKSDDTNSDILTLYPDTGYDRDQSPVMILNSASSGRYAVILRTVTEDGATPGEWYYSNDPGPITPGTWTHIGLTWGRDSGKIRYYINGVQNAFFDSDIWVGRKLRHGLGGVYLGHHNSAACAFDDLRIWSREISAAEMVSSMNTPVS